MSVETERHLPSNFELTTAGRVGTRYVTFSVTYQDLVRARTVPAGAAPTDVLPVQVAMAAAKEAVTSFFGMPDCWQVWTVRYEQLAPDYWLCFVHYECPHPEELRHISVPILLSGSAAEGSESTPPADTESEWELFTEDDEPEPEDYFWYSNTLGSREITYSASEATFRKLPAVGLEADPVQVLGWSDAVDAARKEVGRYMRDAGADQWWIESVSLHPTRVSADHVTWLYVVDFSRFVFRIPGGTDELRFQVYVGLDGKVIGAE